MKKRKYLFVGAAVLILILSTTGSQAVVKSNEKELQPEDQNLKFPLIKLFIKQEKW